MQLPLSSTAVLAYIDPSGGIVNLAGAGGVPYVRSIVDPTSGLSAYQLSQTNQPLLVSKPNSGLNGIPDFSFDGAADHLIFDSLASKVANLNSFTLFLVAACSAPAGSNLDLFTFGKSAADGYTRLFVSGSKAGFADKNDAAVVVAPATAGTIDTKPHLYTLIKNGSAGTMTLRLDGVQIVTASVTGAHSFNTCSIAALRNNSTTNHFFPGNIGEIAVYNGVASFIPIESYFTARYLKSSRTV